MQVYFARGKTMERGRKRGFIKQLLFLIPCQLIIIKKKQKKNVLLQKYVFIVNSNQCAFTEFSFGIAAFFFFFLFT